MIKIRHLQKSFGQVQVLKDISTEIRKGECVCVIGPSGSGKSTFLRCINLLEQPDGGSIEVDGRDILDPGLKIDDYRKEVGMVFQHFNLFPHKTILDNITMAPIKLLGKSKEEAEKRAMELLELVGLEAKAKAYPSQLSGGQKQKLFIILALIPGPRAVFLDELTTGLDTKSRREVWKCLLEMKEQGLTICLVSHFMDEVEMLCDRIGILKDGNFAFEGTVKEAVDNSPYNNLEDAYLWWTQEENR